jgi:hypothetical protein
MWLLVILSLINAAVGSQTFLFEYRWQIAGMPVNILDILLILGVIIGLGVGKGEKRIKTERPHRLLLPILIVFSVAILVGIVGGIRNLSYGLTAQRLVTYIRDFAVLPMGVFVGYQLVPRLKSAYFYRYVVVAAGCLTALAIFLFFRERGEEFGIGSSLESLRTVDYVTPYAGIAAAFLFFTMIAGPRILPLLLAAPIAGFCLMGDFATLTRSDWLATTASIGAVYRLLPKGQQLRKLMKGLLLAPVLGGFLLGGIYATSKLTGRDFSEKITTRLRSMLPGEQEGVQHKAWDTRLPGALRELELWSSSPLIGRGLGIQYTQQDTIAYRHNSWTCILAETGLIGFTGALLVVVGCIVVGRRMVRDRFDAASILMGALGTITGVHYLFLGMATNGFVNQRSGLLLSLTCGMVLRTRAMGLAMAQEYQGYLGAAAQGETGPLVDVDGVPIMVGAHHETAADGSTFY